MGCPGFAIWFYRGIPPTAGDDCPPYWTIWDQCFTAENILITSGSQQALDLIGKVFINPGDRILVEEPTYLGALQAWNAYGAEYVTVPNG